MTTAICYPLFFLPAAYLVVRKEVDERLHAYTGNPVSDTHGWVYWQMESYTTYVIFFCFAHYLVQRNLLLLTLEKVMIKR